MTAVRYFLGMTFLVAGASKIWSPWSFAEAIQQYHILPSWLVGEMAVCLPGIELVCAGCLIVGGSLLAGAALVTTGLSALFLLANVAALMRGLDVS